MSKEREKAREILKAHREVSPTCALIFTEDAIVEALTEHGDQRYEQGRKEGLEEINKIIELLEPKPFTTDAIIERAKIINAIRTLRDEGGEKR